jgi:signal transduction histidine kinase
MGNAYTTPPAKHSLGAGRRVDDRLTFSPPALLSAWMYSVVLFALALALGMTGDLAACGWIQLPAVWISRFAACDYVAIFLAAVRYGPKIGLGAAALAGLAHVIANTMVCRQVISQQSEVAVFLVVGLVAGVLAKGTRMGARTEFGQGGPAKKYRGEVFENASATEGGRVPVGFVEAARVPLSVIESAAYVLEDAASAVENHREVAAIILKECRRLNVLIRLLEFVRTQLPVYEEAELSSMLDEIVRRGSALIEASNITLRKEANVGLRLVCDSELIEQAALNLLANAIRIVEPGDELVLSARSNMNNAVIEILHPRLGVLGQLGITMAAAPEGPLHENSSHTNALLKPEAGNQ